MRTVTLTERRDDGELSVVATPSDDPSGPPLAILLPNGEGPGWFVTTTDDESTTVHGTAHATRPAALSAHGWRAASILVGPFDEAFTLTGDRDRDLSAAVKDDHPCDDATCDIVAARENGHAAWAAWTLNGATEAYRVEAVLSHYGVTLADAESDREGFVTLPHVQCAECGHVMWAVSPADLPMPCSSCLATVPAAEDGDAESTEDERESFLRGYSYAILWANTTGPDGADRVDPTAWCTPHALWAFKAFDSVSRDTMESECDDFTAANLADLREYARRTERGVSDRWMAAGSDFALTRNGHGAGFWDRGLGELGDRLTAAAKVYGEQTAHVAVDGSAVHLD